LLAFLLVRRQPQASEGNGSIVRIVWDAFQADRAPVGARPWPLLLERLLG
jgi:hypothetical protein